MKNKPNILQRFILWVYNLPVFLPLWRAAHHHLDALAYKLTGGKSSLTEVLGGIAIIQLTTIGAKSRQERTIPIISIYDGKKIALIASNFGRQHNPGWYYNLKANPQCKVNYNGETRSYVARETEGEEREFYWQKGVNLNYGYKRYKRLAAHRQIPIMLLEPLK